ncbi:S8/S53 family peptidase [Lacinutrix sp.]|uniref:S8/S53 family peptidase n=1 Tax=Lacinutrix sp. TaxID=1937692 RepID=UPI0025BC62F0|nr:S8/S53 family peptidase [Lacinutrix sp.]
MLSSKRNVLIILLLTIALSAFSQEQKYFTRLYIKLSPSLHFESPKELFNIEEIKKLQENYSFEISNAYGFSKEQIKQFAKQSKNGHTLKNTFKIEALLNIETSNKLLSALQNIPHLVYAYQSNTTPITPPHDIAPATSNFENNQGYIESNPGLNIRYAWNNGINAAGINIRDVEYGINLNHEELDHTTASQAPNTTINPSASSAFTEHGTSVAGIVFANKGTYGVSGIAHGANEYVLFPEWTVENNYNRVLATANAISNSAAGDIIIYEMQTFGQNNNVVLAEYEQAIWDLTKAATDAGIVIVAAAGNGSENLDDAFYNSYNARGDSGAIIVGAGSANISHVPLWFTTHGSRVNVHAWGENVYTIGENNCDTVFGNDFNQTYNSCFSGTSSATALVGGFTAVLQSYYLAQTGGYLTSQELRTLIVNTGIAQGSGVNIGPLPNMEAAILELNNTLSIADKNISTFIMYPNPTKGILNINLTQSNNSATVTIHNVLGQKVLNTKLTQRTNSISVNNLSKGLYLVTLKTEKNSITKKLIIN